MASRGARIMRCTVHTLPVEKLKDAAQDPALASLLADGWDPIGSVVVDPGDGRGPALQLLLRPPRKPQKAPEVPGWVWAWAVALSCAVAALAGLQVAP